MSNTYLKIFGLAHDEKGNPDYAGMKINMPLSLAVPIAAGLTHKKESEIEVISAEEYYRDYGDPEDDEDEEDCDDED